MMTPNGCPPFPRQMCLTVSCGGAASSNPSYEDTTIYSLDEVPDMISREWWKKYGHNFRFEGNRLLLKHSG